MKSRELNTQESSLLDNAWNKYLDSAAKADSTRLIQIAWNEYQRILTENHIFASLAGYRVKNER